MKTIAGKFVGDNQKEEKEDEKIRELLASIFPELGDKEIFWDALRDKEITSRAEHHAAMQSIILIKFSEENLPGDLTPALRKEILVPVMNVLKRGKEKLQKESKKEKSASIPLKKESQITPTPTSALVARSITTQPKPSQADSVVQTSRVTPGFGSGT